MAPNMENHHAEYKADLDRWNMLQAFGEGGRSVLEPGFKTGQVYFWSKVADDGTSEGRAGVEPRYVWTGEDSDSFLFSHQRENRERFGDRKMRAWHFPIVQPVLDIYTTGVLKVSPARKKDGLDARWDVYHDNVDMYGEGIDAFMRRTLYSGLNLGRVHAVTDMPRTQMQLESLAEQMEAGIRAYSYLVHPQDLCDWRLDEFGRFIWAVIREEVPDERNWGTECPATRPYAYKVWTRDEWILYYPVLDERERPKEGEFVEKDRATHNLGFVPISTFFAKRYKRNSLRSRSMVNSLVDIDRAIFNKVSLLDEIDYGQTFSQLAIPNASKLPLTEINTGVYEAFTFDPSEGGVPLYISPNPAMAAGLWQRIQDLFHTARVLAGVSRGKAEQSKEERSAMAIAYEAEEKHTQMAFHAAMAEEFEQSLYTHVAAWEQISEEKTPQIEYNRKFDIRSLTEKLSNAINVKALGPGPVAMAAVNKAVVGEFLKQCGVPDKDIDAAAADIETYAQEMADSMMTMREEDRGQDQDEAGKD